MPTFHFQPLFTALSLSSLSFLPDFALGGPLVFNVLVFGATLGGAADSSPAFLRAWSAACRATAPAAIYVPAGRFLLGRTEFAGPCVNTDITFRIDGTVVAPLYHDANGGGEYWLVMRQVSGVSVIGGTIDRRGQWLWSCKARGGSCPSGATSLEVTDSDNIHIRGLRSINSQMFHIVINECKAVEIDGVRIDAPGTSPNTDGIHIGRSDTVVVLNSRISTGDDCISIGPGCSHIWISGVACGPGHGISIGSLGRTTNEPGVQNVSVSSVTFTGTENGVRIKSWGKPSNGFARNISFRRITMNNVKNPIIIDQNYCPSSSGCSTGVSGIRVSDVTYSDIHGTSATKVAVNFECSSQHKCSNITLDNVRLTYGHESATAHCRNAGGTVSGSVVPESCL